MNLLKCSLLTSPSFPLVFVYVNVGDLQVSHLVQLNAYLHTFVLWIFAHFSFLAAFWIIQTPDLYLHFPYTSIWVPTNKSSSFATRCVYKKIYRWHREWFCPSCLKQHYQWIWGYICILRYICHIHATWSKSVSILH